MRAQANDQGRHSVTIRVSTAQRGVAVAVVVAVLLAVPPAASADKVYLVTVDTSAVTGTSGFLDFQFNPGNATSQDSTATISNFASAGTLNGVPSVAGDVIGTLPGNVAFDNSSALNEYFHGLTYSQGFSFTLTLSGPAIDAPNATATSGTTFGLGLYDDDGMNPILTNDGFTAT